MTLQLLNEEMGVAGEIPVTWPDVLAYMRKIYQLSKHEWRMGQAYFNALYDIYPDVANLVRATDADPFYADRPQDPRMQKFFDEIIPYFV